MPLCILAWIAIMIIINRGLKEINDLGKNSAIPSQFLENEEVNE